MKGKDRGSYCRERVGREREEGEHRVGVGYVAAAFFVWDRTGHLLHGWSFTLRNDYPKDVYLTRVQVVLHNRHCVDRPVLA